MRSAGLRSAGRHVAPTRPDYLLPQIQQVGVVALSAIHLEQDLLHGPLTRSQSHEQSACPGVIRVRRSQLGGGTSPRTPAPKDPDFGSGTHFQRTNTERMWPKSPSCLRRPNHLPRRLVFPLPLIRDRPQQIALGPREVGHFDDHLWRTQCTRDNSRGDPNRFSRGGGLSRGMRGVSSGFRTRARRASSFSLKSVLSMMSAATSVSTCCRRRRGTYNRQNTGRATVDAWAQ